MFRAVEAPSAHSTHLRLGYLVLQPAHAHTHTHTSPLPALLATSHTLSHIFKHPELPAAVKDQARDVVEGLLRGSISKRETDVTVTHLLAEEGEDGCMFMFFMLRCMFMCMLMLSRGMFMCMCM